MAGLQFFGDSIDGERRTHGVPSIAFPVGASLKIRQKLSAQMGAGYNLSLANTPHRIPQHNPLYIHLRLNYHFRAVMP